MYGSPPVAAKDLNRPFPPAANNQMSSGLLRYRSAPSSLFGEVCEDFLPARPSSPETESMFARFLSPDLKPPPPAPGGGLQRIQSQFPPPSPPPPLPPTSSSAALPPTSSSAAEENIGGFSSAQASQMMYHQMVTSSMAMDADHFKNAAAAAGGGNSSNLIRQSSSPAGLFSNVNVENGYGVMRGLAAGYRNGNEGPGNRSLRSQLSFSSRQSSGLMSQISEEIENESSIGGYPLASPWEESTLLSADNNNFSSPPSGLKRHREVPTETQHGGEVRNGGLSHQFSLPKTSSEMAAIEKFLQFQDSVPCKIRAKRGCATHPRSIAERVRRTRISERMRKLQELVPNMDKQTNTADMLDLAVDYIKELQKQVKTISENRAKCTCSSGSKQKPYTSPTV